MPAPRVWRIPAQELNGGIRKKDAYKVKPYYDKEIHGDHASSIQVPAN
jgi:hypothetical protein